jgi:hypothetical protein
MGRACQYDAKPINEIMPTPFLARNIRYGLPGFIYVSGKQ